LNKEIQRIKKFNIYAKSHDINFFYFKKLTIGKSTLKCLFVKLFVKFYLTKFHLDMFQQITKNIETNFQFYILEHSRTFLKCFFENFKNLLWIFQEYLVLARNMTQKLLKFTLLLKATKNYEWIFLLPHFEKFQ